MSHRNPLCTLLREIRSSWGTELSILPIQPVFAASLAKSRNSGGDESVIDGIPRQAYACRKGDCSLVLHMFRFVLTILTAATFVAHGLFGCCWHHGHTHVVSRIDGAQHRHCHEQTQHGHSHHGLADESPEHARDGIHDSDAPLDQACDKGQCVFARTQDGPQLSSDVLIACGVAIVAVTGEAPSMPTAESSALVAQNHNASLSAPCCALSQVWLI